ncbi:MAG TPA: hypothetical protein EYP36_12590 [Calditrichaeota bacterium]|nr:hypothetical protein [Calditrichota bacterium]
MDAIFNQLTEQPILLAVFVVVTALLAYFLIKKLLKLALVLAIIGAAFLVYVYFTAENPKEKIRKIIDTSKEKLEQVKDNTGELKERLKEKID